MCRSLQRLFLQSDCFLPASCLMCAGWCFHTLTTSDWVKKKTGLCSWRRAGLSWRTADSLASWQQSVSGVVGAVAGLIGLFKPVSTSCCLCRGVLGAKTMNLTTYTSAPDLWPSSEEKFPLTQAQLMLLRSYFCITSHAKTPFWCQYVCDFSLHSVSVIMICSVMIRKCRVASRGQRLITIYPRRESQSK